jgi:hypothetical protein
MRRLASTGIAALVVLPFLIAGLVLQSSGAAQAAGFPPITPAPVTILPSVGMAATPVGATAQEQTYLIVKHVLDTGQRKAVAAVAAGTATAAETATVTAVKAGFSMPAIKASSLLKVVGPTAAVLSTFALGTSIGSTASRMTGFKDDDVCMEKNGLLTAAAGFLNGVNCDAYNNALAVNQQNLDASATASYAPTCLSTGYCVQLVKMATATSNFNRACFIGTGSAFVNGPQILVSVRTAAGGPSGNSSLGEFGTAVAGYGDCSAGGMNMDRFTGAQLIDVGLTVYSYSISGGGATEESTPSVLSPGNANPDRQYKCTITSNTGGVYSASSESFKETDPNTMPIKCPPIPAPEWGTEQTITEEGGPAPLELQRKQTTPEYQASATNYPECMTGLCTLELYPTASPSVSCFTDPTACADWFEDPAKADNFRCKYGTHVVSLAECNLYSPTFKPDALDTGKGYGNPSTGEPLPGQTVKTNAQSAFGDPIQNPDGTRECFPTGWAVFNPVEWVMKPVQCAMQWAFVPRAKTVTDAEEHFQDKWKLSTPGKLVAAIAALGFTAPSSGCQGLALQVPVPNSHGDPVLQTRYMLPACPGDFFAPWAPPFSILIGGAACVAGFFGARKLIGGIVGYGGPS